LTGCMTADADLLGQFLALDSAAVSDALDICGLPPGQGGLSPMWGRPRVAGFAATVELESLDRTHAGAHILTGAIAKASAGDVLVVANSGRTDVSSWGGIVTVGAAMRSIRGAVIDGACRDVDRARELGFPVFARAQVPVTARGRLQQKSAGAPVRLGCVMVGPGDVVMADEGNGGAMRGSVSAGHDAAVVGRLRRLPTAAISDALDREEIPGALAGLVPLSNDFRAAGPAFTIRYAPVESAGGTVGEQLTISGVGVGPGAIVCADADGVVAVPGASAERIADIAERIEQVEGQIVAAVREGSTLRQARETFGYHSLQRRRS
jgi:regulator of RNase E activity RraA